MRRLGHAGCALAALAASAAASAHNVTEWPLDRKAAAADLVAYVLALDPICCSHRDAPIDVKTMAAVRILTTIKGTAADDTAIVRIDPGIAGLRLDCCVVGARYLMFLERRDDGSYAPVNFHHGIYRLDDK